MAIHALSLPSVSGAKLPAIYSSAKQAIAACDRIDECKDWADKSEALASYAKQADDHELRAMADRIQARAIRRCGELLKAIKPAVNHHVNSTRAGTHPSSRKAAARSAGMSEHQQKTAVRVANVPVADFEAAVEAPRPVTVTKLADQGTRRALVDLKGRDPKHFAMSTRAQGELESFLRMAEKIPAKLAAQGALDKEFPTMAANAKAVMRWCEQLLVAIKEG